MISNIRNFFSNLPLNRGLAYSPKRVVNLSAGCAALPEEVLERAAAEMNSPLGKSISVTEMGYRTKDFHTLMDKAESSFRELMSIPDNYDVHFFNGGATLQFAAMPLNLLGENKDNKSKATYIMNGHWSEKAVNEANKYTDATQVCVDPKGLYFDHPDGKDWNIPQDSTYVHYTSADTRQGFEFQDFCYDSIPKDVTLCCDASANLGSKPVDISKYGVIYAAAHKNFSTSGVCYTIIRNDLINDDVHKHTPTMCNWNVFQHAPNKIWNVPVIFSVWLGQLVCEHMLERGGLPYYEDLAIRRSNTLYNYIDDSDVTQTDIIQGYTDANNRLFQLQKNLYATIQNARNLGMDEATIYKKIKLQGNVSEGDYELISKGVFSPYRISEDAIEEFYENRLILNEPNVAKTFPRVELGKIYDNLILKSL